MAFVLNKQIFNRSLYTKVSDIWLAGVKAGPQAPPQNLLDRWFGTGSKEDGAKFDVLCRSEFESAVKSIGPPKYSFPYSTSYADEVARAESISAPLLPETTSGPPEENPSNALSLVILIDQIPRNLFRKEQKLAYCHYDLLCRSLLRTMLKNGVRPDLHESIRYSLPHRMWFYLPFMHSEHLEDHVTFEELFMSMWKDVEKDANEGTVGFLQAFLDYERKHSDILKQFGRYVHRNVHIGREMTAEEQAYLDGGGMVFGTAS
ncbi:hypothetical protein B7494_g7753 [Chlorociboria aeruginascens]|nr:hypothetical protein B7494_g7753 [Chlorociboria aeruginascens]